MFAKNTGAYGHGKLMVDDDVAEYCMQSSSSSSQNHKQPDSNPNRHFHNANFMASSGGAYVMKPATRGRKRAMMWLGARLGDLEMGVSDLNMRHTRASTQSRLLVQPHPTLPRVPPSAHEIVAMPREDGYHRVGIFWDFEVCPMNLGISGFSIFRF